MNRIVMVMVVMAAAGCSVFQTVGTGAPVRDVSVMVSPGRTLQGAMLSAANRRGWAVVKNADGSYRLSIFQRSNRCVVDVVLNGEESFSILPVESNIPVRKYDQWVDNLRREIIHRAK